MPISSRHSWRVLILFFTSATLHPLSAVELPLVALGILEVVVVVQACVVDDLVRVVLLDFELRTCRDRLFAVAPQLPLRFHVVSVSWYKLVVRVPVHMSSLLCGGQPGVHPTSSRTAFSMSSWILVPNQVAACCSATTRSASCLRSTCS